MIQAVIKSIQSKEIVPSWEWLILMKRGNCWGTISRSDNAWPEFWRMNRILTDEQERGRSIQLEGAWQRHRDLSQLSIMHFSAGCILDLWGPEWFRERRLESADAFHICFVDIEECKDFKVVLNPPENFRVTKSGKQLLDPVLLCKVQFWSLKSLFFE